MTTPDHTAPAPITDLHAALLTMFSQHLPEVWMRGATEGGCSCGKALYVGHIIRPILNLAEANTAARLAAVEAVRDHYAVLAGLPVSAADVVDRLDATLGGAE